MNRNPLWSVALAGTLLAAVALGGCTKKQTTVDSGTPGPVKVADTPKSGAGPTTPPPPTTPPGGTGAKEGPVTPPPPPPTRETKVSLDRIHFDFDKYLLTPAAKATLDQNAAYLKKNPGAQITIEGHCDERGTTEYNLALGERRAKSAFQYLVDMQVDPNRMKTVSFGEEVPLDKRHNEDAWSKNRRAEFVESKR